MRVGIVGLGLIGGSLGLALRRLGGSVEVRGVAHDAEGVAAAQQRGAVDRASTDLRDLSDCDIVVVATAILCRSGITSSKRRSSTFESPFAQACRSEVTSPGVSM